MIPAEYDIKIYEGAAFGKRMQFQTDAGAPIDITGSTISMQIRQSESDATSRDWSSYISHGGDNGVITIDVPSTQTLAFDFSRGVYDIEILASNGAKHKLLYGEVKIIQEVTQ